MDPLIIISIIMSICLLTILMYNTKLQNNIIKYSFVFLGFMFSILIIVLDNKFIYQFLKAIITYLWYPNYLIFVIVILINIISLIFSFFNKKKNIINKIINYILFIISFACYIIFYNYDIDVNLASSLYQVKSLILMRIVTISSIIGIIVKLFIMMRGKNEK